MRPLRSLALLALAAPALLGTVALPAGAALPAGTALPPGASAAPAATPTPSPTPSPTPTLTASPTPSRAADAAPPTVRVGDDASGRSVQLVPGQQLQVELAPAGQPWQGLEDSTRLLQLLGYSSGGAGLTAGLLAVAPGGPQRLTATAGDRTWSLDVEVGPGSAVAARGCEPAPSPSASPSGAPTATASPTQAPGGRTLGPADDGTRLVVDPDEPVSVRLDDCDSPFGAVSATGVLRRTSAGVSVQRGEAEAFLRPDGAGTATLRAQRDAPCAAAGGSTCPSPWTVVVEVRTPPCEVTLTGPERVLVGRTVPLTGRARPGQAVEVLFRRRGTTRFDVRRRLLADGTGTFSTGYAAGDDHRWFARTDDCSSAVGLTQVLPELVVPARVRRGGSAGVLVRAAPGTRVGVSFRRAGTTAYLQRRAGTTDSTGRYLTSFRPDVDHAVRADVLGRSSAVRVVQAR